MTAVIDKSKNNIIEELSIALLCWYPFRRGTDVIIFGKDNAMAAMLQRKFDMRVIVADNISTEDITGKFDYIIAVAVLESAQNIVQKLAQFRKMLNEDGTLLLGMNNRLGLKYFCGDHEPYTGRRFDGVEDYRLGCAPLGRLYARDEIEKFVDERKPYDKSGAYAIQDEKYKFAEKIEGSIDNVVGFPIEKFKDMIKNLNSL